MSEIQTEQSDVLLIRQYMNLFPSNPFTVHTAPPASRTAEDISAEKRQLYSGMLEEAQQFDGTSKLLIEVTADLAVLFHHNQFRKGGGDPSYISHVAEVGKRAGEATDSYAASFPSITDARGETLHPKAIAIALGRLHDAIEDFGANFDRDVISSKDAGRLAEAKIRVTLTKVIGPDATSELLERIKGLSLKNNDEFPDKDYVAGIIKDPYMTCCKAADYDHNLETFPGFTEAYPLFIVPAQYQDIIRGTSFEESYAEKLLNCLNSYDENEVIPWKKDLREKGVKTSDVIKDLFDTYNEADALERLRSYYEKLDERVKRGDFDTYLDTKGLEKNHLHERFEALLNELEPQLPSYLRVIPEQEIGATTPEVQMNFVGNIPVQLLGPMRAWGGELLIKDMSLDDAKSLVERTGKELGCRFPGYFSEADDGSIVYHISRYPRRAGLEVPPLEEFRSTLKSLHEAFTKVSDHVLMQEETLSATPGIRIVLGLREGYFDQRKEDIEAKIEDGTFSDIEEIKMAIAHRLGDLGDYGIEVDSFSDPKELRAALQGISLSILHDIREVSEALGPHARVRAAEIYSVSPDYTYSEEAVIIEVPADREHFEKLVQIADATKQARFTTERLDTGLVVNLELKAFTEDRSATMI